MFCDAQESVPSARSRQQTNVGGRRPMRSFAKVWIRLTLAAALLVALTGKRD